MKTVNAAPRASALIESMRDIGYSIETAVADIIDNSITAGATHVDIRARFRGSESFIAIVDDGHGMSEPELIDAMRPGCMGPLEDRAEGDLGRFGLGLKTASFSQCRRLTVVSRTGAGTASAIWDLDRVAAEDDWTLLLPDDPSDLESSSLLGQHGTVVVWEQLDRLADEDGVLREAEFNRLVGALEAHLALVFYRFLLGRNGASKLVITINSREIEAYDPFFTQRSFAGPEAFYRVGDTVMRLQTFTLPHYSSVSKVEWEKYGGSEGYLKNQGFYLFRGNRLIVHGTWFGLMRQGELTKLTRVALDLPTTFDAKWKVDVKKASAQPPAEIRRYLRGRIENLNVPGKKIFRKRGQKAASKDYLPMWQRLVDGEQVTYEVDFEHPAIAHLIEGAPETHRAEIRDVLRLVASALPLAAIYNDVAGSPENILPAELEAETLEASACRMAFNLYQRFNDDQKVLAMLKVCEPFAGRWAEVESAVRDTLGQGVQP